METQRFLFVPYETRNSPEIRRILSGLQEEKKEKPVPVSSILFFSLVFNLFFAFCVIATFFLPPEKLGRVGKMMILGVCFVVITAAMGFLIGMLRPPEGEEDED